MEEEEEVRAQPGGEHRDAVLQEDPLEVEGAPGRQALRENSSFFKQYILCLLQNWQYEMCFVDIKTTTTNVSHNIQGVLKKNAPIKQTKMAKHGRLANLPKWSKVVQSGPKGSELVNLDVFDNLGPFWTISDKNQFVAP